VNLDGDIDLDFVARLAHSAVFSDVCDALGYRDQTAAPGTVPLWDDCPVVVGWARPVVSVEVEEIPDRPYGREIDFIDSLAPGDVVVANVLAPAAFWGELFSAAALGRGARGTVVDGLVRDTSRIRNLDYPVYARGHRPTDSLGRISIETADEPMFFGGVQLSRGDLVVADRDGVTIVPRRIAAEAISLAVKKATTESLARQLLLDGATLREAWERFRVL